MTGNGSWIWIRVSYIRYNVDDTCTVKDREERWKVEVSATMRCILRSTDKRENIHLPRN